STKTAKVVQIVPLPGASGGVAIDPGGGRAYVSGIADSTNKATARPKLPGGNGDVIHVFRYSRSSGKAKEIGQIAVPAPSFAAPPGGRAYVTITNLDQVAVIDVRRLRVVRRLPAGIGSDLGASPNALAVTRDGRRLLATLSGADVIAVWQVPRRGSTGFRLLGRVPTARYPSDVQVTGGPRPRLLWLSAKGLGVGPNP